MGVGGREIINILRLHTEILCLLNQLITQQILLSLSKKREETENEFYYRLSLLSIRSY